MQALAASKRLPQLRQTEQRRQPRKSHCEATQPLPQRLQPSRVAHPQMAAAQLQTRRRQREEQIHQQLRQLFPVQLQVWSLLLALALQRRHLTPQRQTQQQPRQPQLPLRRWHRRCPSQAQNLPPDLRCRTARCGSPLPPSRGTLPALALPLPPRRLQPQLRRALRARPGGSGRRPRQSESARPC